jgi:hypothetical protein
LELPSSFPPGYSERLLREAHDDLDELAGGGRLLTSTCRARGEREQAEQADEETPQQGGSW